MTTDEQIWQIAKKYLCNVGSHYINEMAMPDDGRIEEFAHELIALAQQVEPLEFERDEDGYLIAPTLFGEYEVFDYGRRYGGSTRFSFESPSRISKAVKTEAEAIAAANEDYQRRVLSCLVHGGV